MQQLKMQSDWRGTWMVLRCSNGKTLALVNALNELGIQCWTPMWVRKRRFPRSNQYRPVLLPCLPSFVFVAEPDVKQACAASQACGVPGFSVMSSYGTIVRIPDHALESLRRISHVTPQKQEEIVWPEIGSTQKIISGAFQGMEGKVVGRSNRHCLVDVLSAGKKALKIPPFLLTNSEA